MPDAPARRRAHAHFFGAVAKIQLEDCVRRLDWSLFAQEGSIMQAVCTTGLFCTVGKLSHGRRPAWLMGKHEDECVFIEKRLDAVQPHALVRVTSLNSYNNVLQNVELSEEDEETSQGLILVFPRKRSSFDEVLLLVLRFTGNGPAERCVCVFVSTNLSKCISIDCMKDHYCDTCKISQVCSKCIHIE